MIDDHLGEFDPTLTLAGRPISGGWDRIRRYCGLDWSGGPAETWAYRYYDTFATDPAVLDPADVLAAAALHPGLSRADLAYFWDHRDAVTVWLAQFPADALLRDADDPTIEQLCVLAEWEDGPSLSLLTKVLHRKRPGLVPLVDSQILDWYRPVTGERSARAAWPALLHALRADLGGKNALLLALINNGLEAELGQRLSHLRLVDIAIWMGGVQ